MWLLFFLCFVNCTYKQYDFNTFLRLFLSLFSLLALFIFTPIFCYFPLFMGFFI